MGDARDIRWRAKRDFNNTHTLRASALDWAVSLKQSAFAIETSSYTSYEEMRARTLHLVDAAAKVIDSDFFTRVGLRYVYVIDSGAEDPIDGWVNPELTGPLLSTKFRGVHDYAGRLQGADEKGGWSLHHGIRPGGPHQADVTLSCAYPTYLVDVDVFRTAIARTEADEVLDALHRQVGDMFDWALGAKAQAYLSINDQSSR